VILYSFHPGGTIGSSCKDLGGFKPATDLLSHIDDLGCNAIWLMPLEDKSIYWPRDYYKLQEGLGSPQDYKGLTAKAHQLGMRVWQDCVPHGGCNEYPRAKEHPEWLVQKEDGSTLHYWCFDFNWPSWIQYMSDVVSFYTREYELDGFRIDACGGSKIPNWNSDIPYARASHAQAQGGLAMQRALRKAVKAVRKDGANLAEVGSSIHGTVSDSTYDFDLCYRVMHDYRKLPAAEFVSNLQQWLHEQQYAELPDLVRMRHLESHDSLRSGLWYGAAPQRALLALISWIHGIPMIYHEMEKGNTEYFRRIFHLRNHVAELNMGSADYLAVKAPDGVFACLRSARLPAKDDPYWDDDYSWDTQPHSAERSSVVLVNLIGKPVQGSVDISPEVLPEALRGCKWVRDLMTGEKLSLQSGAVTVSLPAFGYTVLRFESNALPEIPALSLHPVKYEAVKAPVNFKLKCGSGSLVFDSKSGMPTAWKTGWFSSMPLLMDMALPESVARSAKIVPSRLQSSKEMVATTHVFGSSSLETHYEAVEDGVRVHARWTGEPPVGAALLFEIPEAETWFASSAEGRFESPFRVRHPGCEGVISSIYRLPQGTSVIWDSRLHPFGLDETHATVGALCEKGRLAFGFDQNHLPVAVQILDRIGDNHGMKVLIRWSDQTDGVKVGGNELVFTIRNRPVQDNGPETGTGDDRLVQEAGGWRFENENLRVRFSRNGRLCGIWRPDNGSWQRVLENGGIYNDRGYGSHKHYAQENDVEAYARLERDGSRIKISFQGALRGFYRFDKMAHPISFYTEYVFDDGDDFGFACAVKPETPASGDSAFLSMMFRTSAMVRAELLDGKQVLLEGERNSGRGRYLQTSKSKEPGHMPTSILLEDAKDNVLCLNDVMWFGALPKNVFMDAEDLHLAWMDGPIGSSAVGRWSGMRCRIGFDGKVTAVNGKDALPFLPFVKSPSEILRDGDFEGDSLSRVVLLSSGAELVAACAGANVWSMPEGAERVVEDGRSCMRVVGDGVGYLLVRQVLSVAEFKSGTSWRLHAKIKARGVEKGDPSWKTACLRWAVRAGEKTHYATASQPLGDSDWHPVQVDMKMPDGIGSISVEAGLNGNKGTIWVDDFSVEKLGEE
jgi:glycosidase